MQVELAQIPVRDGEVQPNLDKLLATLEKVDVTGGTELVVFPETTLVGFPSAARVPGVAQPVDGPAVTAVREAAAKKGVAVAFGFGEEDNGRYHNTTLLVDKTGAIVLRYRKSHLWPTDVGVFTPGDSLPTAMWNGRRVGILICFDIEFPETARALATLGADLLIVTNGNMDPYGPVHARAITARAMENQIFAVMSNRCGTGTGDLTFPGESAVVDPFGNMVVQAGKEETLVKARIDWSMLEESRKEYRYAMQRRIPLSLRPGATPDCLEIAD